MDYPVDPNTDMFPLYVLMVVDYGLMMTFPMYTLSFYHNAYRCLQKNSMFLRW